MKKFYTLMTKYLHLLYLLFLIKAFSKTVAKLWMETMHSFIGSILCLQVLRNLW